MFSDALWIARLAFLADVTEHLNVLNLQLQGKDLLICDLYSHIHAFEVKLQLWEIHLEQNNFTYFPRTGSCQDVDVDTCVEFIRDVKSEFKNRFEQFTEFQDVLCPI